MHEFSGKTVTVFTAVHSSPKTLTCTGINNEELSVPGISILVLRGDVTAPWEYAENASFITDMISGINSVFLTSDAVSMSISKISTAGYHIEMPKKIWEFP